MIDVERVRPCADQVLVRLDARETRRGSLMLPMLGKERNLWGTVLAAGPGKISRQGVRLPLEVRSGDRVRLLRMSLQILRDDGDDGATVLVPEELIGGVLEGGAGTNERP